MRRIAVIGNGGGGPWPVIDRPMGRADTIVYVDLPFRTHLWWAVKRQVSSLVRRRGTLRRVHAMRSDLLELVTKSGRDKKIVHLRSPREIARWLGEVTRAAAMVAD